MRAGLLGGCMGLSLMCDRCVNLLRFRFRPPFQSLLTLHTSTSPNPGPAVHFLVLVYFCTCWAGNRDISFQPTALFTPVLQTASQIVGCQTSPFVFELVNMLHCPPAAMCMQNNRRNSFKS